MSGFFQRPSLRADTFENHENHPQPKLGGLKAAFQSRALISDDFHNNASYYRQPGLNESRRSEEYHEYPRQYPSAKPVGLKGAFDRRISGHPRENDTYNDSTVPHRGSDSQGGLKAAFQTRNSSSEAPNPGYSGLRGAFLNRQQSIRRNMEDNSSDSTSNASVPFENVYSTPVYQDIDGNEDNGYIEDQESLENDYPAGYHSIHRLSHLSNRQGGSNLKRAFDARTGGTTRRNLGKGNQKEVLLERHANIIVSKMERDDALMEDSPDAEELRRTALRDMPQCLTIKRCVKVKLSKSVSQKSKRKPLSCWKMFKYRCSMGFTKLKINIRDLAYSFELWYEPLKKIEGNFGTGVASFFKFLRWLFLVNLTIAIVSTSFIVIPKVIYNPGSTQSINWNIISDLITGEGYLTNTVMYYGFYTNESVSSNSSLPYSMPHAYFFTMLAIYFISFAVIGISAAKSYRRSFIETEGGLKNVFANKIFCGWDYNIATKDAADLKSKAIYNEIKELIFDFTKKRHKETFYRKFLTVATQVFMNVFIFCLIAATALAIWYFLNNVTTGRDTRIIVAPIFINTVMTFMPMFLSFIVRYEDYKNPKVSLYLTLARTFLLGAVTIGVLVAYWLQNDSKSSCWETSLAQEFYRMIVFDFFISVVCAAGLEVILYFIYKFFTKNTSLEFDIAWNTMQIIYNQTLFWVGLVFSPLLPVALVLKLFLAWYVRLGIALFLCKPSSKTWRAAQTSTWFLVMTFLSLIFIGGIIAYITINIQSSTQCGPFRNYDHIYEIVTLGLLKLKSNSTVWQVVLFGTKPGVIAVVLIFLCAMVYYLRAQANAQKEIVEQCRNMLVWSAKDKEYYYSLISKATKGQWQYKVFDRTVNPELYDPDLYIASDGTDTMGETTSSPNLSSPQSGATFVPSSMMSFDVGVDDQYSRYKKYT